MKKGLMTMKESQKSNCWVFTFGVGQLHEGKYVLVYGKCGEAREKMTAKYGDKWAFQYSIEDWERWLAEKPWYVPAETQLEVIR